MEQTNHTVNGWVEGRKNIREDHLPLYDSLSQDIIQQLASQGVYVEFETNEEEESDDAAKAKELMTELQQTIHLTSMDPSEYGILRDQLNKLNHVLFGEDLETI